MDNMVVIKKYENRRLYDTSNSRYVNLDEVAQMVRDGIDIRVADATTGEDLTRLVLTQIIVENAKAPNSAFPLDMLRHMVIASGRMGQESVLKSMKMLFDMYQSAYRTVSPLLSPFDLLQSMTASPQPSSSKGTVPPQPHASGAGTATEPELDRNDQAEVRELRRRVEQLEKRVAKSGAGSVRSKRSKSSRHKS